MMTKSEMADVLGSSIPVTVQVHSLSSTKYKSKESNFAYLTQESYIKFHFAQAIPNNSNADTHRFQRRSQEHVKLITI